MKIKTKKKIQWEDIYFAIKWLFRCILIITFVIFFTKKNNENVGYLIITFLLTYYDWLVKKFLKIKLEPKLKIAILLFIFSTQYLGTILDIYGIFPIWDTILHSLSGVLFTYIGFVVLYEMNKRIQPEYKIHPIIRIAFAFCFTLAIGVLWEIFEFSVDSFLGGNMQVTLGMIGQEAVKDTMVDLIAATLGSLAACIWELKKTFKGKSKS